MLGKLFPHFFSTLEKSNKTPCLGLVILLHHFDGNRRTLLRHRRYYRSLGFDVLSYDFSWHGKQKFFGFPRGMRERWIHEFFHLLKYAAKIQSQNLQPTPETQPKIIVHALSSFASVAMSGLGRHKNLPVDFLICENGPFFNALSSFERLLEFYKKQNSKKYFFLKTLFKYIWDPHYPEKFPADLMNLKNKNPHTKILLLAGEHDPLVPPSELKLIQDHIPTAQLSCIKNTAHLDSLKTNPAVYDQVIKDFLKAG